MSERAILAEMRRLQDEELLSKNSRLKESNQKPELSEEIDSEKLKELQTNLRTFFLAMDSYESQNYHDFYELGRVLSQICSGFIQPNTFSVAYSYLKGMVQLGESANDAIKLLQKFEKTAFKESTDELSETEQTPGDANKFIQDFLLATEHEVTLLQGNKLDVSDADYKTWTGVLDHLGFKQQGNTIWANSPNYDVTLLLNTRFGYIQVD